MCVALVNVSVAFTWECHTAGWYRPVAMVIGLIDSTPSCHSLLRCLFCVRVRTCTVILLITSILCLLGWVPFSFPVHQMNGMAVRGRGSLGYSGEGARLIWVPLERPITFSVINRHLRATMGLWYGCGWFGWNGPSWLSSSAAGQVMCNSCASPCGTQRNVRLDVLCSGWLRHPLVLVQGICVLTRLNHAGAWIHFQVSSIEWELKVFPLTCLSCWSAIPADWSSVLYVIICVEPK